MRKIIVLLLLLIFRLPAVRISALQTVQKYRKLQLLKVELLKMAFTIRICIVFRLPPIGMDLDHFVYCVKGIMLLDSDGNRLIGKYYDNTFAGVQQEKEFERKVFNKTRKLNSDIILLDGLICVYKSSVDLYFCVIGSGQQDELILYSVLNCFYETVVHILKKSVEKKTLYECVDMVMLAIDEICDSGVILETDYNSVLSRLAFRSDELSFSEQTVAQVLQSAREQLKWSLLK